MKRVEARGYAMNVRSRRYVKKNGHVCVTQYPCRMSNQPHRIYI